MKTCMKCRLLFQEKTMACKICHGNLVEVNLHEALQLSDQKALHDHIGGRSEHEVSDDYKQYHVRSYLKNRSLFLDHNLNKNRLKHGRGVKRFFISPVSLGSAFNLPWFLFNVISTNLFHLTYTEYCPTCKTKFIPGQHTKTECDYNIEYFKILDDIISGLFVYRKNIYEQYAEEKRAKGHPSAFLDLFYRNRYWESFWDILSIGFSLLLWLYLAVYVSFPFVKILAQKIQQTESIELLLGIFWSF